MTEDPVWQSRKVHSYINVTSNHKARFVDQEILKCTDLKCKMKQQIKICDKLKEKQKTNYGFVMLWGAFLYFSGMEGHVNSNQHWSSSVWSPQSYSRMTLPCPQSTTAHRMVWRRGFIFSKAARTPLPNILLSLMTCKPFFGAFKEKKNKTLEMKTFLLFSIGRVDAEDVK